MFYIWIDCLELTFNHLNLVLIPLILFSNIVLKLIDLSLQHPHSHLLCIYHFYAMTY